LDYLCVGCWNRLRSINKSHWRAEEARLVCNRLRRKLYESTKVTT
jgi:hypothetical protein